MSTINNNWQINSSWYTQSSYGTTANRSKNTGTQGSTKASQALDSLVSNGTITEDQEAAIKEAMEAAMQSSVYARHKIQGSESSNKADGQGTDPLAGLVEAGTLTVEQKEAVKAAFDAQRKEGGQRPPPLPGEKGTNPMDESLSGLVEAGTITEDQKDAIIQAFQSAFESGNQTKDSLEDAPPPATTNFTGLSDYSSTALSSIADFFQYALKSYDQQTEDMGNNLFSSDSMQITL